MQIFVKGLSDRTYTFEVEHDDLIFDLKVKIESKVDIPCYQQRLIYAGRQLDFSQTISESQLSMECMIYLCLRLRGGMYDKSSGFDPEQHHSDFFGRFETILFKVSRENLLEIRLNKSPKIVFFRKEMKKVLQHLKGLHFEDVIYSQMFDDIVQIFEKTFINPSSVDTNMMKSMIHRDLQSFLNTLKK